jgi:hypothetical protein
MTTVRTLDAPVISTSTDTLQRHCYCLPTAVFSYLERVTRIPRVYIALGCFATLILFLFYGLATSVVCSMVGLLLPLYHTLSTVDDVRSIIHPLIFEISFPIRSHHPTYPLTDARLPHSVSSQRESTFSHTGYATSCSSSSHLSWTPCCHGTLFASMFYMHYYMHYLVFTLTNPSPRYILQAASILSHEACLSLLSIFPVLGGCLCGILTGPPSGS